MTIPVRRRAAALLAAAAVTVGPVVTAGPALAHASHHRAPACTITVAQRTEATDAVTALKLRLAGHKPTAAERQALNSAIAELWSATRQVRMTDAVRKAKRAEYATLAASLRTATTAEQRTAIRAELRAIRGELASARPTRAELRALQQKMLDLKIALRAKPTKAEKWQILSQIKALKATLACATAPATSTTTPGTSAA
jgi:hypothetical protein